jgi:hypothetical protein
MQTNNNAKLSEQGYFSFCRYIIDYHKEQKKSMLAWLRQLENVDVKIVTPKQAQRMISDGDNINDDCVFR